MHAGIPEMGGSLSSTVGSGRQLHNSLVIVGWSLSPPVPCLVNRGFPESLGFSETLITVFHPRAAVADTTLSLISGSSETGGAVVM